MKKKFSGTEIVGKLREADELPPFYVPVIVREFPTYTLCIGTDAA